ncbi:alpha/beta fold hydrolase [Trueperella sp. LYQ143]|uniref:alpha/beta fold hydrolase n=1 Tax=Trueperella sp. LYQ143 TaxID=3391059 RepID=UPI0039836981
MPLHLPLASIHSGRGPLVIACHGVTDTASALGDLIYRLHDRYHVVALDTLGHGLSREATPEECRNPLPAALRALSESVELLVAEYGPAVGIGHSMGGGLITRLAADHPQWFVGVVGEDPAWLSAERAQQYQENLPDSVAYHQQVRQNPAQTLATNYQEFPSWPQRDRCGWLDGKLAVDLTYLAAGNVGYPDWQLWATNLRIPTLIITGDAPGVVIGRAGVEQIHALNNPQIETVVIPEAPHCVRRHNPEEFHRILDEFLARVHP